VLLGRISGYTKIVAEAVATAIAVACVVQLLEPTALFFTTVRLRLQSLDPSDLPYFLEDGVVRVVMTFHSCSWNVRQCCMCSISSN
jgi:hypothetical protein